MLFFNSLSGRECSGRRLTLRSGLHLPGQQNPPRRNAETNPYLLLSEKHTSKFSSWGKMGTSPGLRGRSPIPLLPWPIGA